MLILIMHTSGTSYKIIGLWCYSFFHICFAYFDAHYNMISYNVEALWNQTLNLISVISDDYILSQCLIPFSISSLTTTFFLPTIFPWSYKSILSNLFGLKTMQIIIMLIFFSKDSSFFWILHYYFVTSPSIYQNSSICIHAVNSRSKRVNKEGMVEKKVWYF